MKIEVRSRSGAKEFLSDVPWAAIQISTYKDDWPKLNKCQRVNVLQLFFDDIDELDRWSQNPEYSKEYTLFDSKLALIVWNFVDLIKKI